MTERTTPLKVLIAEDEPAMLSLVARHVRSLGFSVVEASEGDVAWELAQKHRPDLRNGLRSPGESPTVTAAA